MMTDPTAAAQTCHVSRRILNDRRPVGYMVRDELGWSFLAGDETQEYVDTPENLAVLALAEIGVWDPAVTPHLSSPVGTALVRAGDGFVPEQTRGTGPIAPAPVPAGLNPDFPVVSGPLPLSPEWEITLDRPVNRRVEDGTLVLWRPGFTARLTLWRRDDGQDAAASLARLLAGASPDRYDERTWFADQVRYAGFRLHEPETGAGADSFYGFAVGPSKFVQLAVSFDDESELAAAGMLLGSARVRTERA